MPQFGNSPNQDGAPVLAGHPGWFSSMVGCNCRGCLGSDLHAQILLEAATN
jgi:hypothetical protein